MLPTVLRIGRYSLSGYTAALDLGILLALVIFGWRARRRIARPARWWDAAMLALASGVLGGRVAYVVAHRDYFALHAARIPRFWTGGLSWHGALVGALLLVLVYCWSRRLNILRLTDELSRVAPLVSLGAALGCLMVGCGYGRQVIGPNLLAAELPDLFGVWSYRYNVQLLVAAWSLVVLVAQWVRPRRLWAGTGTGLFMSLFCGGMAVFDSLRADAVPYLASWRLDVILDAVCALLGILILFLIASRTRKPSF